MKKTYYNSDIKNPYLSNGEFLWKNNDDNKLVGEDQLGMGKDHEGEKKASKNITKITKKWKEEK
jgi:hypothetical protein